MSKIGVKKTKTVIANPPGINLLVAQKIAHAMRHMKAVVVLRCGGCIADAKNILSIVALCAAMGTSVDIESYGPDELYASKTIEGILSDSGPEHEVDDRQIC